jgi:hypothetical protein
LPVRTLPNAILAPSGDQFGSYPCLASEKEPHAAVEGFDRDLSPFAVSS